MSMRRDNLAPVITVKDTKTDQLSRIGLSMSPIVLDEATAAALLEKVALTATISRKKGSQQSAIASSSTTQKAVADESVRDTVRRCFPDKYRGLAPVVSVEENGVGVRWERIVKVVGGVESGDSGGLEEGAGASSGGATKSVPFWKKTELKWAKMAAQSSAETGQEPEVIETERFEKYFPTRIRNRAPMIRMRAPNGENDRTAFLEVGSEFVGLSESLARRVQIPGRDQNEPQTTAAATVEKYFGGNKMNKAPVIDIEKDRSVVFEMKEITRNAEEAGKFKRECQASTSAAQ